MIKNLWFFKGDSENVEKFTRRLVKVTPEHADDCKKLLKFMGVPYIDVDSSLL